MCDNLNCIAKEHHTQVTMPNKIMHVLQIQVLKDVDILRLLSQLETLGNVMILKNSTAGYITN